MLLNFYKRLEIKEGQVIWPVNPSRNFIKNLKSNVPKNCSVPFNYPGEPVDIIIYWLEKKDSLSEVLADLKDKFKTALWIVQPKTGSNTIPEAVREIANSQNMIASKIADFTLGEYGTRFVNK